MVRMKEVKRYTLLACAWITCILGCVGIFVPVLPTTPFLLLSTFLFAKSSPRLHAWIQNTKVYHRYVLPFKDAGGITLSMKIRILVISYAVMGLSAWAVYQAYVKSALPQIAMISIFVILGGVVVFLLYLMFIRIPTISREEEAAALEKQSR